MTTIFVSPHLDDVVLSAPGRVLARTERGERVVVLTVFSEGDARYAGRREEDRSALAILGAEPALPRSSSMPLSGAASLDARGDLLQVAGPRGRP